MAKKDKENSTHAHSSDYNHLFHQDKHQNGPRADRKWAYFEVQKCVFFSGFQSL